MQAFVSFSTGMVCCSAVIGVNNNRLSSRSCSRVAIRRITDTSNRSSDDILSLEPHYFNFQHLRILLLSQMIWDVQKTLCTALNSHRYMRQRRFWRFISLSAPDHPGSVLRNKMGSYKGVRLFQLGKEIGNNHILPAYLSQDKSVLPS